MTKDKALKLALEALVEVKSWKSPTRWDGCFDKEITAIKKALSSCQCPECRVALHASDCAVHNEPAYPKGECNCGAQPEQEPVAMNWSVFNTGAEVWDELSLADAVVELTPERLERGWSAVCVINKDNPPAYTAPPPVAEPHKRKPLSDEEIILIVAECASSHQHTDIHFARAIEQAHGIKELKEYKK